MTPIIATHISDSDARRAVILSKAMGNEQCPDTRDQIQRVINALHDNNRINIGFTKGMEG